MSMLLWVLASILLDTGLLFLSSWSYLVAVTRPYRPHWVSNIVYYDTVRGDSGIIVLRKDFFRCRILVANWYWIWLKPLLKLQNWLRKMWYSMVRKLLGSMERKGWLEIDYSCVICWSTIWSWFKQSPKYKAWRNK